MNEGRRPAVFVQGRLHFRQQFIQDLFQIRYLHNRVANRSICRQDFVGVAGGSQDFLLFFPLQGEEAGESPLRLCDAIQSVRAA